MTMLKECVALTFLGALICRTFSTAGESTTQRSTEPDTSTDSSKVVVFGGSGFVGSRVCEQATRMGARVVSISRHGRPPWLPPSGSPTWADAVQWEIGDALDSKQTWRDLLHGCAGVVSTLGAFGSNDFMYKICGTANIAVIDAARDAKVPRFAFISVHDYSFPAGWHAKDYLLKGYFQGKRDVEAHLAEVYPDSGVALRPGFIYGSRAVGNMKIPLGLVGSPLAAALKLFPTTKLARVPIVGAVFVPPVSVDSVGKAAASAVLDSTVPPGPMDVWTIASTYST